MLILDIFFIDGFMSCVEKRRTKLIKFHFIVVETVHFIATNPFHCKTRTTDNIALRMLV